VFRDPESAFRAKLAEQMLRIEEYQRDLNAHLGKKVNSETAARRWIEKYAGRFSDLF
jgi:hypothetical protein